MLFYQECWDIRILERGTISEVMNATFIVLVTKKETTRAFSDFRPISLVGSLYKIIAKVLSVR